MPKIQWQHLPPAVLSHLVERVRERAIGAGDLKRLDDWKRTEPEAPDGQWYKDFGSFKICGKGALPLTVLTRDQKAFGTKL
jgi:hypothetical protein